MTASWSTPVDAYCERLDATFWAEPVNALTNGAFFLAALGAGIILIRHRLNDSAALLLILLTVVIGTGSFLFHTVATRWAGLADVIPIALFILVYFYLAMRRLLGVPLWGAVALTVGFELLAMVIPRLWQLWVVGPTGADPLNGSAGYLPALFAMLAVGGLMLRRDRTCGLRLLGAGGVFALSLAFRSIDREICAAMPLGSHFLWHLLNGLVLFLLMRAAIFARPRRARRPRPAAA